MAEIIVRCSHSLDEGQTVAREPRGKRGEGRICCRCARRKRHSATVERARDHSEGAPLQLSRRGARRCKDGDCSADSRTANARGRALSEEEGEEEGGA